MLDFIERMSGTQWRPETFMKFSNLDERVQKHLQRVYATLACSVLIVALGTYVDMLYGVGGVFTGIASFGCLLGLMLTPSLNTNYNLRYSLLAAFAFCQGCSISPIVGSALVINPTLVLTAVATTATVFICFTLSALMTKRRSYLFLGGYLSAAVMGMMVVRLGSMFTGSRGMSFELELYAGVLIFSAYILFDTQLIVEKASAGEMDHIRHALDLLVDLLALFVRILLIIMRNNQKKESEDNRRRRRSN